MSKLENEANKQILQAAEQLFDAADHFRGTCFVAKEIAEHYTKPLNVTKQQARLIRLTLIAHKRKLELSFQELLKALDPEEKGTSDAEHRRSMGRVGNHADRRDSLSGIEGLRAEE